MPVLLYEMQAQYHHGYRSGMRVEKNWMMTMKTKIYTQAEVSKIKVEEYNKGVKSVLRKTIVSMMAAYNIVLADKYGWDGDQLSEINAKVDDQFKSINDNYNTLDELIEAVHEAYGILFE